MRVCHGFDAVFDDPNLVSCAGLAPVLQLAERAGLHKLVERHLQLTRPGGGNAQLKIPALVAGMIAGADSIDDMDLLRHGAMNRLFTGVRAPSTLGTFLRSFTFGHVRQLNAVHSRLLINLARQAPLLPGAAQLAFVDVDDTLKQTYGYAKQGAGRGYTGVKGLNALLATISTPSSAPVIAAAGLRKGSTNSGKGSAKLIGEALGTARKAGASGLLILRADSAYYRQDVIEMALRQRACFSITARLLIPVRQAIDAIPAGEWTPIKYTNAGYDEQSGSWVSNAEVAEISYTAFASKAKAQRVTARLIVRRVPDLNPDNQSELFTAYRYHAVFTNSPLPMLQAEKMHRAHAIVEQVKADLKNGPLAHLPSGQFWANSAWLICAAMAFNLTRAAGTLASSFHAKATTGTIRAQLITVPARLAKSARRLTMHLATAWPWENAWQRMLTAQPDHPYRPDARQPVRQDPTGDSSGDSRPARRPRPAPILGSAANVKSSAHAEIDGGYGLSPRSAEGTPLPTSGAGCRTSLREPDLLRRRWHRLGHAPGASRPRA